MRKPAIPKPPAGPADRVKFDQAVKERLEILGGERDSRIQPLQSGASTDAIVAKINELIGLMQ